MRLWSIGHSTRSLEELVAALRAHRIEALADVRSLPRSARHPQFNEETLARELPRASIAYWWLGKELGGYRPAKSALPLRSGQAGFPRRSKKQTRPDSPHTALRSAGFRHYADHMETKEFKQGVDTLLKRAAQQPTAYLCAERLWWRCHRSLLSDYLTAIIGAEVIHIHDEKKTEPHRLHRTARLVAGRLVYDVGESAKLALE